MRLRLAKVFLAVILVLVLGFVIYAWRSPIAPLERPTAFEPGLIQRGAQLAAIGNCAECHTARQGRTFAGGYPLETPFGTIYGTNITPDPETGIGRWSLAAFTRAMREGVSRDGSHLYPAFPYDHYTLLTDEDIGALYGYFMTLEPIRSEPMENEVTFPLNIRMTIAGWKALYLKRGVFQPQPGQSAEWNRGAYLTDGLGHCGACHTPRNLLGAEKRDEYLAGAELRGWIAPALDATSRAPVPWTAETLHQYLRDGIAENHPAAAGPMAPVVQSLRGASADDVRAMAVYIASLMGTRGAERTSAAEQAIARSRADAAALLPRDVPLRTRQNDALRQGAAIYAGTCAICHASGRQTSSSGDAIHLALATAVALPQPTNLIRVTLQGLAPPDGTSGPIMPGFAGALTDAQVAALAQFLRAEFSDQPEWKNIEREVREVRGSLDP